SAWQARPSRLAMARTVAESRPPERRTTACMALRLLALRIGGDGGEQRFENRHESRYQFGGDHINPVIVDSVVFVHQYVAQPYDSGPGDLRVSCAEGIAHPLHGLANDGQPPLHAVAH